MEKLAAHITKIGREADEEYACIPKDSAMALAEQARNLSIEFQEWVNYNTKMITNKSYRMGGEILTTEQLWDKFLEQKTF